MTSQSDDKLKRLPAVSAASVERLAIRLRQSEPSATPFAQLTPAEQAWLWDHARSELQAAGITVATRAHWVCPIPAPDRPPRSPQDLLAVLDAAKVQLADVPPEVAAAVLAARCFIIEIIDAVSETEA